MPMAELRVESAVAAGVDFLLQSRHTNDLWYDFRLAPGWSDEWVSGYVGDRLASVVDIEDAIASAWWTLMRRTGVRPAGWGYNAIVPQDADSTSWVLRLASHANALETAECQRALASLSGFRHPGGLFGTYGPTEQIRAFIGADDSRSFRGWTAPHACVTAAAATLPGVVDPQDLLAAQLNDGSWRSYWWPSDTFATALAVEAVGASPAAERAADWVAARDRSESTAFELANDIIVCVTAGTRPAVISECLDRLVATQGPDGSWLSGAVMRVPDPSDETPWEERQWQWDGLIEGAQVGDTRRVFTTATVVHALGRARDTGGLP